MRPVTVYLPDVYIEALDQLVRRRLYANRAEAIRMAIRDLIVNELTPKPEAEKMLSRRLTF
jgi:Arc/MetJ-type ribon-helix-helix transcriptional regulator